MRIKSILFLFVSFFTTAFCQTENKSPEGMIYHYSTDNGLSHSGVMCMLQDHLGLMWFGTWDGLNKFDGYHFTTYKSEPGGVNSLSHNRIDDIKEDKYGNLWVKTYDEKVHRFNRKTETFQSIPEIFQKSKTEINIARIISTPKGNIWLLTYNKGCYKISTDSLTQKFTVHLYSEYSYGNYKINSDKVNFIHEDAGNNTWISSGDGLNVITGIQSLKDFCKMVNGQTITCKYENYGYLWFGTASGKFYNVNIRTGAYESYTIPGKPNISCLIRNSSESLIIGTKDGNIIEWKQGLNTFRSVKIPGDNGQVYPMSFYSDLYGLIWIETNTPGIYRFNDNNFTIKHFIQKTDKVSPYVYYGDYFNVYEDINNNLWINLKGGGFCYYNRKDDEVEYFYNEPGSLTRKFSNMVTYAMSDTYGNLWLSTHSRGLEKICFIKDKFHLNQQAPESHILTANEVRAVFEDNNQILWVSTKEGKLYCYKRNHKLLKIFSSESSSGNEIKFKGIIYCITQDKEGALWFGTKGSGIIKATPVGNPEMLQFKTEYFVFDPNNKNSLNHNWVYNIFEDTHGRIWAGTYGGGINLLVKAGQTYKFLNYSNCFKKYPHPNCDKIRYIQEDNDQNIWVGTTNGLIIIRTKNKLPEDFEFSLYQKESMDKTSLSNNDVHYILKDKKGQIWVSTFGGGLCKVIKNPSENKKPVFKVFTTENGLPIDIILSMLEDKQGNLWLATENGISKFDTKNETFTNFSELDGIKKLNFSEAACCTSKNGDLYFGAYEGFYSFNPKKIVRENESPRMLFVNFQLFNKNIEIGSEHSPLTQSINLTQSVKLNHNQSVFSIEYAGLDYRNSDKLEYAFKLEGFENAWNYVKFQRKATYTNLPPGKYTFKVMCSSTGIFDENKCQNLEIEILPPWWKTKWAMLGYFIFLIILAYIIWKIIIEILHLRNKVIIEQKLSELKLHFFTNISHELRTPLTLIMGPVQDIISRGEGDLQTLEYLKIVDKNAHRLLRQVNNILDFRKIESGKMRLKVSEIEIVSFVRDIFTGFKELAKTQKIDFTFNSDVEKLEVWVDPDKMDSVIFNLLSNAFKFTPEGKKIEISVISVPEENLVKIEVKDHGVGIAPESIPYLFQRFAISNETSGLNSKGTGLGLSLVKDILTLHKGNVEVNSIEGEGSTFTISILLGNEHFDKNKSDIDIIPVEKYRHAFANEIVPDLSAMDKQTLLHSKQDAPILLIVEDNLELLYYLTNSLKSEYNIYTATDGLEGLNGALKYSPDLIISDIMMPKMDGIQMVEKIRDDFKTSHIPIILLTAKSGMEDIIKGIKYGADAYLTKPFNMDLLNTRINALIEQRKKLAEKYNNPVKVMDLSPDEVLVTPKDEQFLKDVMKIIEENIGNPDFSVDKIATTVGLGRTTFFKKLKGLTGLAPVEFLREMKLKRGHQLLETSEFTVSEIAFKLGFSDAGYFTKCFKEKYNITPTEVLRSNKSK
jgi:signal transduction histidine kinase/ligand-binding sensor domain-containing protein/CheY-like chemotaxis protein/AraC-like DNA-binding protein